MEINQLLSRRSDLSTFVVHLTRAEGDESGSDRLRSILGSRLIEARSAYGQARLKVASDADAEASQKVVCFTETPLEHLYLLTQTIEGLNRPRFNGD